MFFFKHRRWYLIHISILRWEASPFLPSLPHDVNVVLARAATGANSNFINQKCKEEKKKDITAPDAAFWLTGDPWEERGEKKRRGGESLAPETDTETQ